jgi:hypothetical protein
VKKTTQESLIRGRHPRRAIRAESTGQKGNNDNKDSKDLNAAFSLL